jgi:hypothetical protein
VCKESVLPGVVKGDMTVRRHRSWLLLAVGALALSSCSASGASPTSVASTTSLPATTDVTTPPTSTSVADGRYINPVALDNGTLVVPLSVRLT